MEPLDRGDLALDRAGRESARSEVRHEGRDVVTGDRPDIGDTPAGKEDPVLRQVPPVGGERVPRGAALDRQMPEVLID